MFPSIDPEALRRFSEIYGHGAFACRYLHCLKENRGFNSSKQRDAHEATHERKLRCADPSCFSTAGFATKSALKKHNDKWHPIVNASSCLSETISRTLAKQNMPTNEPHNDSARGCTTDPESAVSRAAQDQVEMESLKLSLFRARASLVEPFESSQLPSDFNSEQIQQFISTKIHLDTWGSPMRGWQDELNLRERMYSVFNL
jgi:hypothetical protein